MKKILMIVDNENLIPPQCVFGLYEAGFEVGFEPLKEHTFDLIESQQPHLIVIDLAVSKNKGIEIFRAIRTGSFVAKTPIVVLADKSHLAFLKELQTLGVNDILLKPLGKSLVTRIFSIVFDPDFDELRSALSQMHVLDQSLFKEGGFEKVDKTQCTLFPFSLNGIPLVMRIDKPFSPRRLLQSGDMELLKNIEIYAKYQNWKKIWPKIEIEKSNVQSLPPLGKAS